MKKENELILELTERLYAAINEKNEMEAIKNKIIKEQTELIKMLSEELG
jgi:hypothetical protein